MLTSPMTKSLFSPLGKPLDKFASGIFSTDMIFTMRVSALETITLPATGTNNFVVDWGDDSSETVTTPSPTHQYTDAGDYEIRLDGTCTKWYFNNAGSKDNLIAVSSLGIMGWEELSDAFKGCANVISIKTGNTDISLVTNLMNTFRDMPSLTTLDLVGLDTSSILIMYGAFRNLTGLTTLDISNLDVSNVTSFRYMFFLSANIQSLDVSDWDTLSGELFLRAFSDLLNITTLDISNWDMSSATSLNTLFAGDTSLTTLDMSAWDVSLITDYTNAFLNCPLDQASQDSILFACVAGGQSGLTLDISGGSETPSGAGLLNKDILVADGWTVTVNT